MGDEQDEEKNAYDPPDGVEALAAGAARGGVGGVEGAVRQIDAVVAGSVLIPTGALVGTAAGARAGAGRDVCAADGAFGGRAHESEERGARSWERSRGREGGTWSRGLGEEGEAVADGGGAFEAVEVGLGGAEVDLGLKLGEAGLV